MARINYKMYPIDYIIELQQQGKREKARCFFEYFHDMQLDQINSMGFYAKSWGKKGKGVPSKWIKEFSVEIEKFFGYWQLKNEQHYSCVNSKSGRKVDEQKTTSGHENLSQVAKNQQEPKPKVDAHKSKSGHKMDQGLNTKNINNINAQSKDCANKIYKKYNYTNEFEILWNLYDKKTSNKKRSQDIYLKRWAKTDSKLLKAAIESYKLNTNSQYYKDFDRFLNGVIDPLIPKKAWIKDKELKIHKGIFYDKNNQFISDSGKAHDIDPSKVARYMELGYFGYIGV